MAIAVGEWIGYPLMLLALLAVSFVGVFVVDAISARHDSREAAVRDTRPA